MFSQNESSERFLRLFDSFRRVKPAKNAGNRIVIGFAVGRHENPMLVSAQKIAWRHFLPRSASAGGQVEPIYLNRKRRVAMDKERLAVGAPAVNLVSALNTSHHFGFAARQRIQTLASWRVAGECILAIR